MATEDGERRGLILAVLLTAACQPTVYLMPTPEVVRAGKLDPFAANPNQQDNRVAVAYATNPTGSRHRGVQSRR